MATAETEVITEEEAMQSMALTIREGANLPEARWADARITAAYAMLPEEVSQQAPEVRDACLIHFFSTAETYGLSVEAGEIYGWWDGRAGKFVTMVGRDGLLQIASRIPDVLGVTSDVVRDNDEFRRRQEGDRVIVIHESSPFGQGQKIMGAYALVRRRNGPDKFVARMAGAFKHLHGKKNWKMNPAEMLETRCIAIALRMSTSRLSNVYTEAEFGADGEIEEVAFEVTEAPDGIDVDSVSATEELETALGADQIDVEAAWLIDECPGGYALWFDGAMYFAHRTHELAEVPDDDATLIGNTAGYEDMADALGVIEDAVEAEGKDAENAAGQEDGAAE